MSMIKIKYKVKIASCDVQKHISYLDNTIRTEHIESTNWSLTYTPVENEAATPRKERDYFEWNKGRVQMKDIVYLEINGKVLIKDNEEVENIAEFTPA